MVGCTDSSNGGDYGGKNCSVVGSGIDGNSSARLVVAVVDGGDHLISKGENICRRINNVIFII